MKIQKLHIVTFDNPYPPNYGGVQDVFYKLKALSDFGVEIKLHIFSNQKEKFEYELKKIVTECYFYKKNKLGGFFSLNYPYRTFTRRNGELLENLKKDNFPIFFEGIHSAYLLTHPTLKNRKKAIRLHNIEQEYMLELTKTETHFFKKYYYFWESFRFKNQEKELKFAQHLFTISPREYNHFKSINPNTSLLPVFHENTEITSKTGFGDYLLFHGNLSVPENYDAANFLIDKIAPHISLPIKIVGKNPPKWLKEKISTKDSIDLEENVSSQRIYELVQNAHILFLYTQQNTGVKLKLINSLFQGRHCLVNLKMVEGTEISTGFELANSEQEFILKIEELKEIPFTEKQITERKAYLESNFGNKRNAEKLLNILENTSFY